MSRSCVYDSFSEDTAEESLDMGEDSAEEEANKLDHVKRKILQDSTILSVCSESNEPGATNQELEVHSAFVEKHSEKPQEAPKIIITEASMISPDIHPNEDTNDNEDEEIPADNDDDDDKHDEYKEHDKHNEHDWKVKGFKINWRE